MKWIMICIAGGFLGIQIFHLVRDLKARSKEKRKNDGNS